MWTDGRYYLQAARQLEEGWEMMKWEAGATLWPDHIKAKLSANQVVGLDFSQYPAERVDTQIEALGKKEIVLKCVPNLVDIVWGEQRPARPSQPATVLDIEFSGKSSLDKQAQIADKLKDVEFEALLVTALDDVAWLTNLRGTDIDYNPVFFSYLLFHPKMEAGTERTILFTDESKVAGIQDYLASQKITVRPYEAIETQLEQFKDSGRKVGIVKSSCNAKLWR